MPARKLPEDYHKLAESKGIKWMGPEVSNARTRTGWECDLGHQWETTYKSIQNSEKGCPTCGALKVAASRRNNADDYHKLAAQRGFIWLGSEIPKTSHQKTLWRCPEKHEWETSYSSIQRGNGCHYCSGHARKTAINYHALAKKYGFKWMGTKVVGVNKITSWECGLGHKWGSTYGNISQGYGCPHCYGNARKLPKDYHVLATEREFDWLGPEVSNVMSKTWWKCSLGHRWEAGYNELQSGHGCPKCGLQRTAEFNRNKPKDYHALAKEKGFKWLGPKVPNVMTKTKWECKKGHVWESTYNNMQRKNDCPICTDVINGVRVSYRQRVLNKMVGGSLNYPVGPYRIDAALVDEQIAIEYDCWFWHGCKLDIDEKRDSYLIDNGWKVLRVRSNLALPTLSKINDALAELRTGKNRVEIILEDWGNGPTFMDRYKCASS